MCARKVVQAQKKAAPKVTKKVIAKKSKTTKVVKAPRVKLGELPETYVRGFHKPSDLRKMKYSPLGKTGMNVSQLSFGAASLGSIYADITEETAVAVVTLAIKKGMNYIDTAAWYGHGLSEKRLG